MKVTTAINGHHAFEIMNKSLEGESFDLVVLDLNMPISDGYETCQNVIKLFNCQKIFDVSDSSKLSVRKSHLGSS